jgi:quinohemoprotein ethanol dehydrogenase
MKAWPLSLALLTLPVVHAADAPAFSAEQLMAPPTQAWITNGGTIDNQRHSPLTQIDIANVASLKGVWHAHLNGSGVGPPYSGEAQPIVYDGVIYIPTGADDVFALDVETGSILWTYQSQLDKKIDTVCCGWANRGVGLGEGKIFLGRLDGKLVALEQRTGAEVWSIQAERWQDGYTITSAPLYYDGMVILGFGGAEYGTRGRIKAYRAKDGALLWTFYTIPAAGELGHDTWPSNSDAWKNGGAAVWQTPAVDPGLGLIYFSTGNAGPDYNGSRRKGNNLFSSSIVALEVKTGKYRWHFQEVHHDIWDYDAPNPIVLFDIKYHGRQRRALAQVGKTGWVYVLDRVTGKPLIGIDEKAVPQEPRQATSRTQPIPRGEPTIPQKVDIAPYGFRLINQGRTFTPFWDKVVVVTPGPVAGPNWPPSSYNPALGYLFVCANDRSGGYRVSEVQGDPLPGKSFTAGRGQAPPLPATGIFAAMDMRTNKIVWRQRWDDRCYSGSINTASDLLFTGRNDGRFVALDASNGDVLWQFQTGAGVNATASVFEYRGQEQIVVYAAGNLFANSPAGDNVWLFSLDGKLEPVSSPMPLTADSISMNSANAEAGRGIFAQYCSQCHGQDGKSSHSGAPDITAVSSNRLVIGILLNGKNGMPSFAKVLKPEEIRDVVQFVTQSLSAASDSRGATR